MTEALKQGVTVRRRKRVCGEKQIFCELLSMLGSSLVYDVHNRVGSTYGREVIRAVLRLRVYSLYITCSGRVKLIKRL
jgi:hypothetical protein